MQRSQNRSQTFPKRAGLGRVPGDGGAGHTPQNRLKTGQKGAYSDPLALFSIKQLFIEPFWLRSITFSRLLTRVNMLQGTHLDVDRRLLTCSIYCARTAYRETNPATNSGTWLNKGNPARGSRTESGKATSPRWQGWPCPHFYHETKMSDVVSLHGALQLLTMPQAAQRLGISRRSLERLIAADEFPRPLKVGGASRVLASDVSAYISRLLAEREAS